ncbi:unnamed protein product, partial [Ectocarpus sp. 12 AP-2014]
AGGNGSRKPCPQEFSSSLSVFNTTCARLGVFWKDPGSEVQTLSFSSGLEWLRVVGKCELVLIERRECHPECQRVRRVLQWRTIRFLWKLSRMVSASEAQGADFNPTEATRPSLLVAAHSSSHRLHVPKVIIGCVYTLPR